MVTYSDFSGVPSATSSIGSVSQLFFRKSSYSQITSESQSSIWKTLLDFKSISSEFRWQTYSLLKWSRTFSIGCSPRLSLRWASLSRITSLLSFLTEPSDFSEPRIVPFNSDCFCWCFKAPSWKTSGWETFSCLFLFKDVFSLVKTAQFYLKLFAFKDVTFRLIISVFLFIWYNLQQLI